MEKSVKRKLPESAEKSGKMPTLSGSVEENAVTVKDAEVEEFFAILRRIHVANKYFQEEDLDGGAKRQVDKKRKRWRPSLECKDFEEDDDVNNRGGKVAKAEVEENLVLDLNADPATDDDL